MGASSASEVAARSCGGGVFLTPTRGGGPSLQVLKKIAALNIEQKTSAFSKFGCKNAGFVEAIVQRGAELHRDSFHLEEGKVVFSDGTEFLCDAIVACTGEDTLMPCEW
jgi:hypothetical protein